jgi:hypothetical protein
LTAVPAGKGAPPSAQQGAPNEQISIATLSAAVAQAMTAGAPEEAAAQIADVIDDIAATLTESQAKSLRAAVVTEIDYRATSSAARDIDADQVEAFIGNQIEDGRINLEQISQRLARLALTSPSAAREEFAEQMESAGWNPC